MRTDATIHPGAVAARRVHQASRALTIVAAAGGVAGVLATGRYAPAFLADLAFGAIFALECVAVEFWTRDARARRLVRALVRAAWGLTFAVWSALLFSVAVRALRAASVTGADPSAKPMHAHASLETSLEAAAVYIAVVALASACTVAVLSIRSANRPYGRSVAKACAWACVLGGLGVALGFPDLPWLAALGACSGGAVWHTIVGRRIFAHSMAAA